MYHHIAEAAVHDQIVTWYQYTLSLAHYQLSPVKQIDFSILLVIMLISKRLTYSTVFQDKRLQDTEMWKDKPNISYKHITNQWEVLRRVCSDGLIFKFYSGKNSNSNIIC